MPKKFIIAYSLGVVLCAIIFGFADRLAIKLASVFAALFYGIALFLILKKNK